MKSHRDALAAIGVGGITLALYVATLQPDFGGPEDTPKFQFLGYVLGTAHPPGYPLYVMLSHLFVQLPIGTIAYRANLFSAVMASLTCVLGYAIARSIGGSRRYSFIAALGMATGASFWRSAVFAEVYSLAAALVGSLVAALLAWGARGGARRLLGAVGLFAAALGNHLTIVGAAPAALLYVVITDRRVVTLRVVAGGIVICLVGLSQYAFIIERTRHGATYLESRAESIGELVAVVRADRFADQRFAFSATDVLMTNTPAVMRVIGSELGVLGMLLFSVGVWFAIVRRHGGAALLLGGAAGMLTMIVNMSGDLKGFITPVMVLLWPLTALGANGIQAVLDRTRVRKLIGAVTAGSLALALPVSGVVRNYAEADQSSQTGTARFLRALYAQLPAKAGIVAEDYFYDMAHEYFTLPGEVAEGLDVLRVGYSASEIRAAVASGRRVFAYASGATTLSAEGLSFVRTTLATTPLHRWLAELPAGSVVVGATALVPIPLEPAVVGHPRARAFGRARSFEAFALVVRRTGEAWRADQELATLVVDERALKAALPALPGSVEARADPSGARVSVSARPIASVESGLVLAVFSPDGVLLRSLVFREGEPLEVPFEEALYELEGETSCVDVTTDRWHDISAVTLTGAAVATLPQLGSVGVELSFPNGTRAGAGVLLGDGETILTSGPDDQATVGRRDHDIWQVSRTGSRRPLFRLALDRAPETAAARLVSGGAADSVRICGHRPSRQLFALGRARTRVTGDFESEAFFGHGWGKAERTPLGVIRTGQSPATLLLPLEEGFAYRIILDLDVAGRFDGQIVVNNFAAGPCKFSGVGRCEVLVASRVVQVGVTPVRVVASGSDAAGRFTFLGATASREGAQK